MLKKLSKALEKESKGIIDLFSICVMAGDISPIDVLSHIPV